jgi:putative FmdB family regulatory protein
MPSYSYRCSHCEECFEIFSTISTYKERIKCPKCRYMSYRDYSIDIVTLSSTVKKSDSELKTLGDLALRNAEKFSVDEKHHLYQKHNNYKEHKEEKPLPSGMSRMRKPNKIKWPGSKQKIRRKPNG